MVNQIIYGVFVSSTYEDLREERSEVQKALLKLHCFPIGMELFGSADEETWEFIKRRIDECDYYVLIIGDRYGSLADDGLSYTEKEYDYARSIRKPTLIFLHGDRASIRRDRSENDPDKRTKLENFIQKIKIYPISYFLNPHDLAVQVTVSFVNQRERNPAVGYVRADQVPDLKKYTDLLEENIALKESVTRLSTLSPTILTQFSLIYSSIIKIDRGKYKYPKTPNVSLAESIFKGQQQCQCGYGGLFTAISNGIIDGREDRYRAADLAATALAKSFVGDPYDYQYAEFANLQDFSGLLARLFGWGLINISGGHLSLTDFGQKQFGLLMASRPEDGLPDYPAKEAFASSRVI